MTGSGRRGVSKASRSIRIGARRLARGDRLGERLDDARDDQRFDRLLADGPLAVERVDEGHLRPGAPILADREVDADLVLGELAGADLIGVGPGLDREPALEPARLV